MKIFDNIYDIIEDLKNGKIIILVDDKNRENEGDFVCFSEFISKDIINFMITHGRGLLCTPLTKKLANKLNLRPMVKNNNSLYHTNFTISIDLKGNGCTTGISVEDRYKTIKHLLNPYASENDFNRPGHIFPLVYKEGGVLKRNGHTEGSIDLTKIAGCYPCTCIIEILNEDGSMARLNDLINISKKYNIKITSIENIQKFIIKHNVDI